MWAFFVQEAGPTGYEIVFRKECKTKEEAEVDAYYWIYCTDSQGRYKYRVWIAQLCDRDSA